MEKNDILWTDKKRPFFVLLLSLTRYTLTKDKLIITVQFLYLHEEEIRLYRIMDVTLKQSLLQRLFGVGTIHCCSVDVSSPEFDISSVRMPRKVRDILSEAVDTQRKERNVTSSEFIKMDLND